MTDPRRLAIDALRRLIAGGRAHQARLAFKGYTKKQMRRPYAPSGRTPAQILAEYEREERDVLNAIAWLEKLPE